MAKKYEPASIDVKFFEGPRHDESILVVNPPEKYIRLAYPEWCTYELVAGRYEYIGNKKIGYGEILSGEEPKLVD